MALKLIILAGVLSAACVTAPYVGRPARDHIRRANAGGIAAASAPSSRASDLRVVVEGVRSDSGAIMIGLYDSPEGFKAAIEHSTEIGLLNDRGHLVGVALRAAAGTQSIIFTHLRPCRYAVIVFHDENDNGRLACRACQDSSAPGRDDFRECWRYGVGGRSPLAASQQALSQALCSALGQAFASGEFGQPEA